MELTDDSRADLDHYLQAIDLWASKILSPSCNASITPGSPLSDDDSGIPGNPVASMAWFGILTSMDHLVLAAAVIRQTQPTPPAACLTVLRSALLSAAQAIWILGGERDERVCRGLQIALEDSRQKLSYLESLRQKIVSAEMSPEERQKRDALWDVTKERMNAITDQLVERMGRPRDSYKFDVTTVIREIVEYLPAISGPREKKRVGALLQRDWQIAGATVHGFPWGLAEAGQPWKFVPGVRTNLLIEMQEFTSYFERATGALAQAIVLWEEKNETRLV